MEILPGVHWLDAGAVNMYLIVESEGLVLIDAGMPRRASLVLDKIQELNRQPGDLKHILITHADMDHAGSLAAIQAATGATVHAGAATAALLTQGKSPKHMPWLIQFILDTFIRYKSVSSAHIQEFKDGDVLPFLGGLAVLASPGHTMDHHSFYSATAGILFAGDALNTRDGRIQPTPPRITADETAATRSAIRLLELAPALLACGHGPPSREHSVDDIMAVFNRLRRE